MRRCSNGVLWLALFAVVGSEGYSDASEPHPAAVKSPADEQPRTTEALPPPPAPVAIEAHTNARDRKSPTDAETVDARIASVIEQLQQWPPELPWDALPASYRRILKELMRRGVTHAKRKQGDHSRDEIRDLSHGETIYLALINNKTLRVRWDFFPTGSQAPVAGDTVPAVLDPRFLDFGELFGKRGLAVALSAFDSQRLFPSSTSNVPLQYPQSLEEWSWTEFSRNAIQISRQFGTPLINGTVPHEALLQQVFGGASGYWRLVISRSTMDISVTDFERNVTEMLRDVEETYWEFNLAYRTYDIRVEARNSFRRTWRFAQARKEVGRFGDLDELQARQAYFQGRADCEDALQNLYNLEGRLRRLCALPNDDGRIICTRDDPGTAEYLPDWNMCLAEALTRREELRREKWNIKSLELQLKSANAGLPRSRSELQLAKATAVLDNQELQVCHEPTTAFRNLRSHFQATQSNYDTWQNVAAPIDVCEDRYRTGVPGIDTSVLLQAWLTTRADAATAEVAFYASLVEYQKALIDLHFRKGTLLEFNNLQLAESSWTPDAYKDALYRALACSYALEPNE